jgi:hypothetical protein
VVSSNSPPWHTHAAGVCHLWSERGWGVAVHKAHKSTASQDFLDWMCTDTILDDKVLILVGFLDGAYISEMS